MKFNLLFFVRILMRYGALLLGVPLLMGVLVFLLTQNQPQVFESKARVYTGFGSGSSIELENKLFSVSKTNIAYENLLNLIRSRTTIEEVSLRLFTQHMLMENPNKLVIGPKKYQELMETVPQEVRELVVAGDFEQTYENFVALKNSDPFNFLYQLVNLDHPDYSVDKILNRVTLRRVTSSDFIDIGFQSEDPGICQNTLMILTNTFIELNQNMQVNQSDEVVKYFENELATSTIALAESEDELLQFNKDNKLMNYYEETKQIASRKEIFEGEYQHVTQRFDGARAVIETLEEKMSSFNRKRINNKNILNLREKLSELNFELSLRSLGPSFSTPESRLETARNTDSLQREIYTIKQQLATAIDTVFTIDHTPEGVAATNILEQWLDNTMKYESAKAELLVLDKKRLEFDATYARYAPLGATMKRLERKINIAEQEYLSLLHSLGLAKLKQQNAEMQTNIKISEIPFFPIEPNPSKRILFVIVAAVMGFVLTAMTILVLHLMDANINTAARAEDKIGLRVSSIFPAISSKLKTVDFDYLQDKAVNAISRNIILNQFKKKDHTGPVVNMLFSTQEHEGKTFICKHLIAKLCNLEYKILHITYDSEDLDIASDCYQKITYNVDDQLYKIAEVSEFYPQGKPDTYADFDFVLLELPPIIKNPFPVKLAASMDHTFLVVRANRAWSEADANALQLFTEATTATDHSIILNGVKVQEMETVVGEIPRKRSWVRRFVKNLVQLKLSTKKVIS